MTKSWAVILAGGKGTRMGDGLKKEAHVVAGQTMLERVYRTVLAADLLPMLVIEKEDSILRDIVGRECPYAIQSDAAGPVEALRIAVESLPADAERVIIACGDQPFFSSQTMQAINHQLQAGSDFVLVSFIVPDDEYYQSIYHGGAQLTRGTEGKVVSIAPPNQNQAGAATIGELAQPIYGAKVAFLKRILGELPIGHEKQFNFAAFLNRIITEGNVGVCAMTDPEEGIGFNSNADIEAYEQRRAEKS